ncbi:MAG: DUF2208 family protein [Candidatus Brockarchaeota archaeon]|nr:DUF2208 family protein [Candidatus Brockarchaeota archaeon]MBO3809265.1 DUF2208 family protein [Candidatus Brockarchaeota archaeon]
MNLKPVRKNIKTISITTHIVHMAYQDTKSLVLYQVYGQMMILILAALNTYYPEYLTYTFVAFILISLILTFSRMRSQLKGPSFEQLKEIRGSKKIYEEGTVDVSRLMASDAQLTQEMKPLAVSSFLGLFAIIIILVWYQMYFNFAGSLTSDPSLSGPLRFLVFLAGYEVPYIMMAFISFRQNKASKSFAQIPRNYTLFERGLVGQGVVIRSPMDNYEVKLDSKRKFVELISKDEKKPMRVRLYSSKPDELFRLINTHCFSMPKNTESNH